MEKVVLQAREGSDRRVRATSGRCNAENELEEALLELTALKERRRAAAESSLKTMQSLKKNISTNRLHLLAASPPFILALEQALVIVAGVDQAASPGPLQERTSKKVDSELTLASAAAQRLSLHVNAWTLPQLSQELERIWLQAVQAEAKINSQFQRLVTEWERAGEDLEELISTAHAASADGEAEQDAVGVKIRDCQLRAGIEPKAEKAASASTLKPLTEAARDVAGGKRNGTVEGGTSNAQPDIHRCGGTEGAESAPVAGDAVLSASTPLKDNNPTERARDANYLVDDGNNSILLSGAGSKALELRRVQHAGDAWRLALEVIADMRKREIAPTEVTFKTLVECCRCAAAAPLPKIASHGGQVKGSSPAEVYAALKEAGVPERFCYQAGIGNALKGGRRFPEYVADLSK
eukprot:g6393.t1